ncbi:MAG: peptidase [Bacteroides sp. SM23_62_1]|nr:MAG: peptidase [Bacteroides sp. SM23_62_1]
MRLLLISNSTNAGEAYLDHPKQHIKNFLGNTPRTALFIPYAGVTISFNDYENRVKERFNEIGHHIQSIHHFKDPVVAVKKAEVIIVGGGNTFYLLKSLQDHKLIKPVREKVLSGTPYIGWSAGANVACPTISTTNDMPIAQPASFNAFHIIPFQINPHYLDTNPDGHAGETREMRIEEFIKVNRNVFVVGLREGTMLLIENDTIQLIGARNVRIFKFGHHPVELKQGDDFKFLLT